MREQYELVVGLEVHVELGTKTKLFCGCETGVDTPLSTQPNTRVCPVCLGLPGALPVMNGEAVRRAVLAGLATRCRIATFSRMDRKHYFYPDLPKAYQISQLDLPICQAGWLEIDAGGGARRIGITRIHIEEDAGKLTHGADGTKVDLNRAGIPLIELVTEPDFRSSAEVRAFLTKLKAILVAARVSLCRMDRGEMRCDVNLSVRKRGEVALGTRTEMKNINSIAFAARAVEVEFARQVALAEAGKPILQETRRFDPVKGVTTPLRTKENADDYRYFPDPDLPPIRLTEAEIEAIRVTLPELPDETRTRLMRTHGLSLRAADALSSQPALLQPFAEAAPQCREPERLANLLVETIAPLIPPDTAPPYPAQALAALCDLLTDGVIHLGAAGRILAEITKTGESPAEIVVRLGLAQVSDTAFLEETAETALRNNPALVQAYLGGKTKALQALMGKLMAATDGRANPQRAAEILAKKLSEKA